MEPINPEHIKETTLDDEEFMAELIGIYLDDAPPQLELLRAAVARTDVDTVSSLAHRLKGSSGNVGAESLSALCYRLERAGRQSRIDEISQVMPELEHEFGRVQDCLSRIREGAG